MVRQAHLSQPVRVQDRSAEQTEMLETSAMALMAECRDALELEWQSGLCAWPDRLTCLSLSACRIAVQSRLKCLRRVRLLWQNDGVPWSWSGSQGCACGQAGSLVSALEHGAHALERWSPRADRNA